MTYAVACLLLFGYVSFSVEKLRDKNGSARSTSQGVVRKTHELIVVETVLSKSACGHTHTAIKIAVVPATKLNIDLFIVLIFASNL